MREVVTQRIVSLYKKKTRQQNNSGNKVLLEGLIIFLTYRAERFFVSHKVNDEGS